MKSSRWMKLVGMVLSLLIVPTLALAQTGGGTGGGSGNGNGGSVNGRGGNATFRANNPMPVLIYTIWGFGSAGNGSGSSTGVDANSNVSTLVIYDNGLATWSQSNADGSNSSGCSGNCNDTIQVSSSQINQLINQLRQAGAFRRASNNQSATSGQNTLSTVTVFRYVQGSTSVAQTFSFYGTLGQAATGPFGNVEGIFGNFFSNNFGSSSVNGSGGSGSGSGG
jgi:DNA-binding transcriptional regulator YdaS (Cro superfamily)